MAISITLHIFSAIVSDNEPPFTVKSCANTYTSRPLMVPLPATTPSPRYCFFSMPKFVHLWSLNMSNSSKLPSSRSMLSLSLAVNFPLACCLSIAFSPPPRRAFSRSSRSSFILSACLLIKIYLFFFLVQAKCRPVLPSSLYRDDFGPCLHSAVYGFIIFSESDLSFFAKFCEYACC